MTPTLAELVKHYDRPGPRYTGYPMPPVWRENFPEAELREALDPSVRGAALIAPAMWW